MTLDDLEFIAELLANPEVMEFYPSVYSREKAKLWVSKTISGYESHGHGFYLALNRSTHEPVGQVGLLAQHVDGVAECEIGYMIHSRLWRQGYASEAAIASRDYAFDELGKTRLISLIRPINIPSRGVAEKVGMTVEKTTVHADLEHLVYSITRPVAADSCSTQPTI